MSGSVFQSPSLWHFGGWPKWWFIKRCVFACHMLFLLQLDNKSSLLEEKRRMLLRKHHRECVEKIWWDIKIDLVNHRLSMVCGFRLVAQAHGSLPWEKGRGPPHVPVPSHEFFWLRGLSHEPWAMSYELWVWSHEPGAMSYQPLIHWSIMN